jgi:hypothetical protein
MGGQMLCLGVSMKNSMKKLLLVVLFAGALGSSQKASAFDARVFFNDPGIDAFVCATGSLVVIGACTVVYGACYGAKKVWDSGLRGLLEEYGEIIKNHKRPSEAEDLSK